VHQPGKASGLATRPFVGPRKKPRSVDPGEALNQAARLLTELRDRSPVHLPGLREIKALYAPYCCTYYTAAAVSRRRSLEAHLRREFLNVLFEVRAAVERAVFAELEHVQNAAEALRLAAAPSFFGFSRKQGVSVRYALATCAPTPMCGGRCYAHDGRDRDINLVFRGVLNWFLGRVYEDGNSTERGRILEALSGAIDRAIEAALADQEGARKLGFSREARIRFSHVGEMAATPNFTNALGSEIVRREPRVACILYTRHPQANLIDSSIFRINFTLEGPGDPRRRFVPQRSRIVSSAWDGRVWDGAEVNFLEHHVERVATVRGAGPVCPVSLHETEARSCDEVVCDRCFRAVDALGILRRELPTPRPGKVRWSAPA
jgi:hypothetical protein